MKKVLIVVSDYYEEVAARLIKGATEYFDINRDELFWRSKLSYIESVDGMRLLRSSLKNRTGWAARIWIVITGLVLDQ